MVSPVGRKSVVLLGCVLASVAGSAYAEDTAVNALEYYPLHPGNQATYIVNNSTLITSVVPENTVIVNGVPAYAIPVLGYSVEYYTNDSQGLRLHRRDFSNGEIAELSPPIMITAAEASIGDTFTTTGIDRHTIPGYGVFDLNFSATCSTEAAEQVTVPLDTFNAIRTKVVVRETGVVLGIPIDLTATTTNWVARYYGPIRRLDNSNLGIFDGKLVAVSIDTDGDGINVTEDNCPAADNPLQTDTDRDQLGNACDADDDNDGMLDGDEVALGRNPIVNEPAVSGVSNFILSEP